MDLFDFNDNEERAKPLAERMRASSMKEFVGQRHLVAEGSLLRRAISLDRLGSCIFYGPPGCGKTTLANVIAAQTNGEFIKLNAVNAGVADVKRAVEHARDNLKMFGKRTYLMLDECHRFNKAQSDSLLPAIEQGTIVFIGSTTENPYASMTPAIVSRCRVFEFYALTEAEIRGALVNALHDRRKGLGAYDAAVDDDALDHLARAAAGDLRTAYNALELAVLTTPPDGEGKVHVKLSDAEQSIQRKALSYNEDLYYDILSAFCKSLRGSDADAALYYAFRLIEGGCDPLLVIRRLIAHSAEDVGMADPRALLMATAALTAFRQMGAPEGFLPLAEAIIYVCEAEKSNSVVMALDDAKRAARESKDDDIPKYLRDNSYGSAEMKAESAKYKYPHSYGGWVKQQYLPDSLKDQIFYRPSDKGYEAEVKRIRERKGKK